MTIDGVDWGLLAAAGDPAEMGRRTGAILAAVLLLLGLIKCLHISRRETTHTLCVLALMCALGGWFIAQISSLVQPYVQGLQPVFAMVTALMVFALSLLGLILGILGLVDFGRHPGRYRQGRAQAISAIIVSTIFGMIFLGGVVKGAMDSARGGGPWTGGRDEAGEVTRFEEFNFEVTHPGRPWMSWTEPAQKMNADARYGLRRLRPETYHIIIPERLGEGIFEDSQEVVEIAQLNMKSATTSARFGPTLPVRHNGLEGLQFDVEARLGNRDIFYNIWICYTNGFSYQCLTWGRLADRDAIRQAAGQINPGFRVMDAGRVAPLGRGGQLPDFASPHFHYRVAWSNANWYAWPSLGTDLPEAETGALGLNNSALAVMPVWLDGLEAPLRPLSRALLNGLGIDPSEAALRERRTLEVGHLKGAEYEYERSIEDTLYAYRLQVLTGAGYAYLVGAWAPRQTQNLDSLLTDALERVRFAAPPAEDAGPQPGGDWLPATQGLVLNRIGLAFYRDGLLEKAAPFFKAACEWDPKDPAYMDNLMEAWTSRQQFREALAYLEDRYTEAAPPPPLAARRALLLYQLDDHEGALARYRELFGAGYEETDHFTLYIQLLIETRRAEEAARAVQDYLKRSDTFPIRLLEARVHLARKEYDLAIPLLKAQRDKAPANPEVAFALVEAFQEAGLHKEARELLEVIINEGTDSAQAWFLKGTSELNLKWYREAKGSLETALKRAPANAEIESALTYVSSLLGESSTSAIKEPIDPVRVPRELLLPPETSDPPAQAREHGAYYVKSIHALSHEPGRGGKATSLHLVKVLDPAGVSRFSSIQIAFDPVLQSIHVNQLTVTDAQGNVVSEGDPDRYYLLDDTSGQTVSQGKNLHLPIAGLQPGHLITLMVTTQDLGAAEEFRYVDHLFSRMVPAQESILYVHGDIARIRHASFPQPLAPVRLGTNALHWIVKEPPVYRWEPMQPQLQSFLPGIRLADAAGTWEAVSTNYLRRLHERLEPHAPLGELTRGLLEGAQGRQDRLERLTQFAQTNLTYQAIEFGTRALVPQSVQEILGNRYGDCKDHSLLLLHLLRHAGITAHLALLNTTSEIEESLPALDQFNHMVLYLPPEQEDGAGRFLDGTDKGCDLTRVVPFALAGRKALVLDPARPRFETLPAPGAQAAAIQVRRRISVVADTDLAVEETLTFHGPHAGGFRGALASMPATHHQQFVASQLGGEGVEVQSARLLHLHDRTQPFVIEVSYTLRHRLRLHDAELLGNLPALIEAEYLQVPPVDPRLTPFEFSAPLVFESRTSLELPEGSSLVSTNALDLKRTAATRFGHGSIEMTPGERAVEWTARLERPADRFPGADYAPCRAALKELIDLVQARLVLAREEGSDVTN